MLLVKICFLFSKQTFCQFFRAAFKLLVMISQCHILITANIKYSFWKGWKEWSD